MPNPVQLLIVSVLVQALQYVSTNKDISKRILFQKITCPYPAEINHGLFLCNNKWPLNLNDVCMLHCKTGFKPRSTHTSITCLSSRKWSRSANCVEVQCPVPKLDHGQFTCNGTVPYTRLDTCHPSCDRGFKPSGHITVCLQMETWSHNITCVEIQCPALPNITQGKFFCASSGPHKQDDICDLQCDSGFKPSSHITHTQCLSTGRWSPSASCMQIICPDPKPVANGKFICNTQSPFKQNDVCQLQCNHGYKSSSVLMTTVCLSSSTWSPYTSCNEIQCGDPTKVSNGRYHCSSTATMHSLGEVCHLQCNNGFKASSQPSGISCLINGSWSSAASCREIICPDPPTIDHGAYVCSDKGVHKLNDACYLQCDEGFKRGPGDHNIYCQIDDTWNKQSTCTEKRCDGLPEVSHGKVVCNSTEYPVNIECDLQCDPGFTSPLSDKVFCLSDETWTPLSCVALT